MPNPKYYVGVMGYSGQKFDTARALEYLQEAFDKIAADAEDREIVIVSGYTNLGIPALAYKEAADRGWKTAGVACSKATEYECFECDEVYTVGDNWGDESPTFLDMCEIFVRVGGGGQSRRETASAIADGKIVLEYDLAALPA